MPAVKVQIAFYEQYGAPGIEAFQKTLEYARAAGLLAVADAKRGDIGSTSRAYAAAFLGRAEVFGQSLPVFDADALTINAYLGSDGVRPFLEEARARGKGVFVLVKTSNPSSGELQDLEVEGRPPGRGKRLYELLAERVEVWGRELIGAHGYSSLGAVVGATYPREAAALRRLMPRTLFLVPGYGSQGGKAEDALPCFNPDGQGAIVHSARQVIFAYREQGAPGQDYTRAAREAALAMRDSLRQALRRGGLGSW